MDIFGLWRRTVVTRNIIEVYRDDLELSWFQIVATTIFIGVSSRRTNKMVHTCEFEGKNNVFVLLFSSKSLKSVVCISSKHPWVRTLLSHQYELKVDWKFFQVLSRFLKWI